MMLRLTAVSFISVGGTENITVVLFAIAAMFLKNRFDLNHSETPRDAED